MTYDDKQGKKAGPRILAPLAVSPQACLWFAWAENFSEGPQGETATSIPPFVDIQVGDSQISFQVNPALRWAHHPKDVRHSGANGLDGTNGIPNDQRGLEDSAYQSSEFNSEHILPITTHLNKLVAMFEIEGEIPSEGNEAVQIEIGLGEGSPFEIPERATRVFLGFHDGKHWINNVGDDMSVEISID